jgi:hypothetical protein
MRSDPKISFLTKSGLAASVLLLASGLSYGQTAATVSLTAAPATATLPDGNAVPMWGYTCNTAGTTAVPAGGGASCAALNPNAGTGWSPIVITVPYSSAGTKLTVSLTNNLSFTPTGTTAANTIPTSLMIVGQLGGGLGSGGNAVPSPAHSELSVTWATPAAPGSGVQFTPPTQGNRVQSFGTEVAVGTPGTLTWNNLRPGTYLIESGTHPSIQAPMGLYGILVVTQPAASGTPGTAYPASGSQAAVTYASEAEFLLSEIDPVQNNAVSTAVNTAGFAEGNVWSGQPGACGNPSAPVGVLNTCYPPAINYTPLYYLINGVGFDRANAAASLFPATIGTSASAVTGNVLVRFVNAGLRMHVPSIVGAQTAAPATETANSGGVANGFALVAEDGNRVPGLPRVQSEVFMSAGKTYDVMINAPTSTSALPVYDRELSLSGNGTERDAGMVAYLSVNGATLPATAGSTATPGSGVFAAAAANPDTYAGVVPGQTLTVSNPGMGVIANDVNVYGVSLLTGPTNGTLALNRNGTFTYTSTSTTATSDSFTYCANGTVTAPVAPATTGTCSSGLTALVTLGGAPASETTADAITLPAGQTFQSTMATYLAVKAPGVLGGAVDAAHLPLTVTSISGNNGLQVLADPAGGFTAIAPGAGTYTLTYAVTNSLKTQTATQTATVVFPTPSNLAVTALDGYDHTSVISDYRWVIEEDQTFYVNPNCLTNPPTGNCATATGGVVPTLGTNFHTSHMPFIAQGCTGPLSCESGQSVLGNAAVCDIGNGLCRPDTTGNGATVVLPSQVALDPTKRYYISILPGDAANPFAAAYSNSPSCQASGNTSVPTSSCGHGMGGAPITFGQTAVTVLTQPSPYPPGRLSVFVFEDDFPLNGEQDGGGGASVLSQDEPGLGGFQIHLWDAMGGNGDFTGQMTYDMFNQPLTNMLDGTKDPSTGLNACPITQASINNPGTNAVTGPPNPPAGTAVDPSTVGGITGMIVTCPKWESDGKTLSPLAGQAVIANLMPGRWGVIATPAADRIARGEEWLQTNTLDGQKAHDSFVRIGEPSYFQEFGPASFHVSIGFANPAIINSRHADVCNGTDPNLQATNCVNTIIGQVVGERLSRTPDERLYGSGSHDAFAWSQCYVSFGDPDGEDFAFTKCDADGKFKLTGLPDGDWRVTVFDQWNDQLVDGLSTPVGLGQGNTSNCNGTQNSATQCDMGQIASTQWETNMQTRTFIDNNANGIFDPDDGGIPFANVAVRLRDGSLENLLVTDFTGTANFNETFPLFSWYVVETDVTRYKNTGTHVVYDVGGPADGSLATCGGPSSVSGAGYPPCGTSTIAKYLANTAEQVSLPTELRVPGAVYCAGADCSGYSILGGPGTSAPPSVCTGTNGGVTCSTQLSSGRIDPPWTGGTEGWQGFPGQFSFLEFGKEAYAPQENGGIRGHVVYASTRPFDDPQMLVQTQWTPLIPNVTMNLYQEGFAADGVTPTLTLVDTTQTSSWDAWAQGFRKNATGTGLIADTAAGAGANSYVPNMNCPGQGSNTGPLADLFFYSLYNQPEYLDFYNNVLHSSTSATPETQAKALPYNSQFKCYDGMHNWNQVQPAPYDGMYSFPSVTAYDPVTGRPSATNCTICQANHAAASTDIYYGTPMLPAGKYVVEVVVPPGFELVKEEDKNILIGDNFIAPVTQQIGGLGNVFIMPDQASVAGQYNANNAQQATQSLGASPLNSIVPGFIPEPVWPCVGELRTVPDFISLYPQTAQAAPFAGASRNLCDRKEVTLGNQMHAIAKFYLFTSTHIASKFTGGITDDYTSEFDPFSPQFGEKFAPPQLPVSVKDWAGNETNRVYADNWGAYDGMTYSTWEVNPPNPTGYSPTMMVLCMNDPGPIPNPNGNGQLITDPLYTQGYSQFCYELPFMPGTTQYLDTPVVPTSAFAGAGYNNVDCAYPALTPAIREVDGDGVGPWVANDGKLHTITISALGDQTVPNYGYSGPSAGTAPFNAKTIARHYGFGTTQGSGTVTIGGVAATVTSWNDSQIQVSVPTGTANTVPACAIQQQAQFGGSTAYCGQLVVTSSTGQKSVDAVTVTIGGKAPTHVAASASIQTAIDGAAPGDLLIIDPTCTTGTTGVAANCSSNALFSGSQTASLAAHNEILIMWKPVRLQGVGSASSLINANTHPAGKLDPWRREVNCLFGLALNGTPISSSNPYDPTGAYVCPSATTAPTSPLAVVPNPTAIGNFNGTPTTMAYFTGTVINPQVDRLPLEAAVGWDATLNGNLAQLLQEATLMGALEGGGITVLGKGVEFPSLPFAAETFPTGTTLLTGISDTDSFPVGDANTTYCNPTRTKNGKITVTPNPFTSNFMCNPSSIDGLSITDSSQGGGGVFMHGWNHNLQIANNRIANNAGTLSGGINVGQGEFAPPYLAGAANVSLNAAPGSCVTDFSNSDSGLVLPYCQNLNVNIHNNNISLNSSTGDELFSGTPAGAGGVSICTGADYYKFNYNWVCGNLSSGDGGGLGHIGFSVNGDIEHNSILFNQSLNPTIPANGGGIIVMGAPDVDPPCAAALDQDCTYAPGSVGPSDGVGRNLVINANLIMGNAAEAGTGGGVSFQNANGSDVVAFPASPSHWNNITFTNNIVVDNLAGWDGAGVSLQDALNINVINNTIAANTTTATAGVLFTTLGAPLASQQGTNCTTAGGTASCPQPAGLVSVQNSAILTANLANTKVECPANHYAGTNQTGTVTVPGTGPTCAVVSYPELYNNVFWQNNAYYVGVAPFSAQYQQAVVTLYNAFTTNQPANQTTTGQCVQGSSYWDIGVRGDTGPANHGSGFKLNPLYSIITDAGDYAATGTHNTTGNPLFVTQYCDGSRQPPEAGVTGWSVPAGISDATVPNPIFNLTPVATVDEGNNWVNLRWGPLTMVNPATSSATSNAVLGNYAIQADSAAINYIPTGTTEFTAAPTTDFFGTLRKGNGYVDAGAVEFTGTNLPPTITGVSPSSGERGTAVNVTITGTNLVDLSAVTVSGTGVTVSNIVSNSNGAGTQATATFTISLTAALTNRNVTVTNSAGSATLDAAFLVTSNAPIVTAITPTTGLRGTSVPVTITGTNLGGATAVTLTTAGGGGGITCTGVAANAAGTSVTANCAIAANAGLGARNVRVTTAAGGTSTPLTGAFTVVGPAITGITPAAGSRGATVPVTIAGTNLGGATAVTINAGVPSATVTCTGVAANAAGTSVTANCAITIAAATGARNVTVTTAASGASNTLLGAFEVRSATAAISAPVPALTTGGASATATRTGTVTIRNTATGAAAGPLVLTALPTVAKVGTAGGAFTIAAGTTNGCTATSSIAPGGSCTMLVTYTPGGSTATATANVTVTDTGAGTTSQTGANFTAN